MKYFISLFFGLLCYGALQAQGSILPLGNRGYHIADRLQIKTGLQTPFDPGLKYYNRAELVQYALLADSLHTRLSRLDREDIRYLMLDNNEWSGYREDRKPLLRYFYRTPAHFFELDKPHFKLRINPMLQVETGPDLADNNRLLFLNQRGLEIRGSIDERIYFFTNIVESQGRFARYIQDRTQQDNALPGAGFYKFPRESRIFGGGEVYDFLLSQGFVGFNLTKHVGMQLGHGRNFIGNGFRSLLLSDFANNYFYLKVNWKLWKFNYQNIFAELALNSARDLPGDQLIPKKYMAAHYLSFEPIPGLSFAFFEAVVFARNNHFELQYLNPVILYRTVEQALGSPDNMLIGLDGRWNFLNKFQLYAQLSLDEFKFDELLFERRGWWANKYGLQLGLKYIDAFGVDHLDLQFEANYVRPYTFTHRDSSASYSHFNQALAHPLGANFREVLGLVRYQALPRLGFDTRLILAEFGEDSASENWGHNILTPHGLNRQRDFGNVVGQGIEAQSVLLSVQVHYRLAHNLYLYLEYFHREKRSQLEARNQRTHYAGLGLRMNMYKQQYDF